MKGRVTRVPWTVSVIVPRMSRPFAVFGIRHMQVATPFATT